jgi:spermidine synthase
MIPWVTLGEAATPDGTRIVLARRGEELAIRAGNVVLMSSRAHASEDELGERGVAGLPPDAKVLVGGLGLGFTLRAALDALGPRARVVVAELVPEIVGWMRGAHGEVAGRPLADGRALVLVRDVSAILATAQRTYDAILLDVDNGPRPATQGGNRRLYTIAGLAHAARALKPGGRLVVWSTGDEPAFLGRLEKAGLVASTWPSRARRGKDKEASGRGARQVLFVGEKPAR